MDARTKVVRVISGFSGGGICKIGNLTAAYKHSGSAEAARTRRIVSGWK